MIVQRSSLVWLVPEKRFSSKEKKKQRKLRLTNRTEIIPDAC